jgi:SWIM/SEC-C metal-binding protein
MATIGTRERPAIVRVQTEKRRDDVLAFCQDNNIAVLVSLDPDKPEDLADIERVTMARAPAPPTIPAKSAPKVGRNDPCPCGSGKKYKKCCLDRPV